jgi:hypothetical protein
VSATSSAAWVVHVRSVVDLTPLCLARTKPLSYLGGSGQAVELCSVTVHTKGAVQPNDVGSLLSLVGTTDQTRLLHQATVKQQSAGSCQPGVFSLQASPIL